MKRIAFICLFSLLLGSCANTTVFHIVSFDSKGGTEVPSQKIAHGEKAIKPETPRREGYTFEHWTYNDEIWSFSGYVVTEDMTLNANWKANQYKLTLINDNEDCGAIVGSGEFSYDSSVSIYAIPNPGYTFIGWYKESNLLSNKTNYTFKMGLDTTIIAKWNNGNKYLVSLDPNGGTVSYNSINVFYNTSYKLPTPVRPGYNFLGWFEDSTLIQQTGVWKYTCDKQFKAKWEIITYSIEYVLNEGTNNSNNPTSFTVEQSLTLYSPEKDGYNFDGWYVDDKEKITSISKGTTGNLVLYAHWSATKNVLSVISEDESKGTVRIVVGSGYSDEIVTVLAVPNENCLFRGWYSDFAKVSDDSQYSFTMPKHDYSLVAHFFSKDEIESEKALIESATTPIVDLENMTVTYGIYPSKCVYGSAEQRLLEQSKVGPESNGWYFCNGNYYAKHTFKHNIRLIESGSFMEGTTAWFLCKPIVWDILSINNNEYKLVSKNVLDYVKEVKNADYQKSNTRAWLNGYNCTYYSFGEDYTNKGFYNNALFSTDKSIVKRDNGDCVFLPSREYLGYTEDSFGGTIYGRYTRKLKFTEWFQALKELSYYTEYIDYIIYRQEFDKIIEYVDSNGKIQDMAGFGWGFYNVAPSIVLSID